MSYDRKYRIVFMQKAMYVNALDAVNKNKLRSLNSII